MDPIYQTIGLLGTAPQALIDLEVRLHRAAQRLVLQRENTGFPGLVIHHHRRPPVVLQADGSPILPLRPDPTFLEAARWLGEKADFLIISANSPHLFRTEIEAASGRPILSMIDVTIEEVVRRGWKSVGVVGFHNAGVPVYRIPLEQRGIACLTIDSSRQPKIDDAVMRFVEGREKPEHREAVRQEVDDLRTKKVDGIIVGCTELPLILGTDMVAPDLLNPSDLLAEAAVRQACAT